MKILKKITLVSLLLMYALSAHSQVSISPDGQDPHPSAVLDLISDDEEGKGRGLLIPRLTEQQRDENLYEHLDEDAESLMIFNKTSNCFEVWINDHWHQLWCLPKACEGYENESS